MKKVKNNSKKSKKKAVKEVSFFTLKAKNFDGTLITRKYFTLDELRASAIEQGLIPHMVMVFDKAMNPLSLSDYAFLNFQVKDSQILEHWSWKKQESLREQIAKNGWLIGTSEDGFPMYSLQNEKIFVDTPPKPSIIEKILKLFKTWKTKLLKDSKTD